MNTANSNRLFLNSLLAIAAVLLVVVPFSYFLGGRFGYWEHHNLYWLVMVSSLAAVGVTRLSAAGFAKFGPSCLLGFSVGWLMSVSTILALQFATDSNETYGITDMAEQASWGDVLLFALGVSLARFGWLPFLFLFGTLALTDVQRKKNSV